MYVCLSFCTTVFLKTLLQRCYRLVISSLLDLVSTDVPTGYFVSAGGLRMYMCSSIAPQSPLRLFSRDVTVWLFRLYWILFPEMSQLAISSLLEDSNVFCFFSTSPHTWSLEVLLN